MDRNQRLKTDGLYSKLHRTYALTKIVTVKSIGYDEILAGIFEDIFRITYCFNNTFHLSMRKSYKCND